MDDRELDARLNTIQQGIETILIEIQKTKQTTLKKEKAEEREYAKLEDDEGNEIKPKRRFNHKEE